MIDESFYRKTLATFLPSRDMRAYLEADPLTAWQLTELVLGSPVALSAKATFFEEALTQMGDEEPGLREELLAHRDAIASALDELEHVAPNEFLYRKSMWDEQPELYEWHEAGVAPFSSLADALSDLRHEMDEEEWDEDTGCWNVIEKWRRGADGTWENPYEFYFIRDEAVFFDTMRYNEREHWWERDCDAYCGHVWGLHLLASFEIGDIITLDCRPFSPLKYGLVLEYEGRGQAPGYPWLLVRAQGERFDDVWGVYSLEGGAGLEICLPGYSLSYRAERYDGELLEEYAILRMLQQRIREDSGWARELSDAISAGGYVVGSDFLLDKLNA